MTLQLSPMLYAFPRASWLMHGLMDCPNDEFRLYETKLYRENRSGSASKWTMLKLLDELDNEYTCISSLNHWGKGAQGSEILAHTTKLLTLKKTFATSNRKTFQLPPPRKLRLPLQFPGGLPPRIQRKVASKPLPSTE